MHRYPSPVDWTPPPPPPSIEDHPGVYVPPLERAVPRRIASPFSAFPTRSHWFHLLPFKIERKHRTAELETAGKTGEHRGDLAAHL